MRPTLENALNVGPEDSVALGHLVGHPTLNTAGVEKRMNAGLVSEGIRRFTPVCQQLPEKLKNK